jgi:tetratricopeptide (TPR) repeat protein
LVGALVLASVLGGSSVTQAASAPQVAPPPAWVKPAPALPPQSADSAGFPAAIRLYDAQLSFDPDSWTAYTEVEVKVQSSAGLQTMSALPFAWSPYSDTLIFHKAVILRDGQSIDILPKDGAFTVLRRETELAQATLTGELTALLQPDGLQVGDVLDIAFSVRHADPLFNGHPNAVLAGWDNAPIDRARIEAHWPATLPLAWRQTAGWPAASVRTANGAATLSLTVDGLRPSILPAHAPARFQHGRQIDFSAFPTWAALAEVMAPLYVKAAQLAPNSPLLAEADLIAKASTDPKARALAVLQLVQGKVRYLAHAEAEGGYTPQSADDTWRLRYGDCKAKTVLLLALLNRLGVKAEAVLVNTTGGDAVQSHLPGTLFDHVLVRADINGRDYWLDGARQGDRDLDDLLAPNYGWVLPLGAPGAKLIHITPTGPARPQTTQIIRYDASGGVTRPEPTQLKTVFRGDLGFAFHTALAEAAPNQLDEILRRYWASVHNAFTPAHLSQSWDPSTGEETLTADGTSKLDWSGTGLELQHVSLGGKPDIKRDPQASDPDAPYLVDFPSFAETNESVVLPPGDHPTLSSAKAVDLDKVIAGIAYHRTGSITGDVFTVTASQRSLQPEVSAAEARASVEPLTALGDQRVYAPAGPQAKAANDAAALDSQPTDVDGHIRRGGALLDAGRFKEALAEYDAVIAIDPKSQAGWAGRAVAHAWLSDPAALAEANEADALGKPEGVAARARAILAERQNKLPEAAALYRRSLLVDPQNAFALLRLMQIDARAGDKKQAYLDLAALLKASPDQQARAAYLRAQIEDATHDPEAAAREIGNAPASTAEDLVARARAYRQIRKPELARADVEAALKLKPTAAAYVLRAELKGAAGDGGAEQDAREALKLVPDNLEAELILVNAASHRQDFAEALRLTDKALIDHAEIGGNLLVGRAQLQGKLGHKAEMDADFERARSAPSTEAGVLCDGEVKAEWRPDRALADCEKAIAAAPLSPAYRLDKVLLLQRLGRDAEADQSLSAVDTSAEDAVSLNNLCWSLATRNLYLERALSFCDASLKLAPKSSATLDSRGFALLRLNRFDEALAAYDAALAVDPKEYNSLYGRGLTEAKLGRTADSEKDIEAALAGRPKIRDEFVKMGVQ